MTSSIFWCLAAAPTDGNRYGSVSRKSDGHSIPRSGAHGQRMDRWNSLLTLPRPSKESGFLISSAGTKGGYARIPARNGPRARRVREEERETVNQTLSGNE